MKNIKSPSLSFYSNRSDWKKVCLQDIAEFVGGGTPNTKNVEDWSGNIPWVSSSDLLEDDIHNFNISRFITTDAVKNSATKLIPSGSLMIVSRVGVGKFAISNCDICTSQDFTNLILKRQMVNNYFLGYYFFANRNIFRKISQGTSIKGFTSYELKLLEITLPSLPEQQKIADYLSTIDSKIHLLEEKKTELARYKKAMMQKLFAQEIRFKDENGEDFPEWEEKMLGEVAEINKGEQLNKENFVSSGKFKVLNGGILHSGFTEFYNRHGNSITISEGGNSCGYVNLIREDFWLGGHCYSLDNVKVDKIYLYQILKFNQLFIMKLRVGSGLPNIQKGDLSKFLIQFPLLVEQQKIANFLSAIDENIEKVEQQIEQTKEFKKAMLQQMFV